MSIGISGWPVSSSKKKIQQIQPPCHSLGPKVPNPSIVFPLFSLLYTASRGLFYIQRPEVLVVLGRRNRGKYTSSISQKRKVF